jgi:hypothetical protein
MTKLGKTLLYLNLVFSLMMAFMAYGLYHNRIDWSNNKGKEPQFEGELVRRAAQVSDLSKGFPPAESAWRDASEGLAAQEKVRKDDEVWYYKEMEHLRDGAKETDPARTVEFKNNVPVLDAKNLPKMVPTKDRFGNPLRSMTKYAKDIDTTLNEIALALTKYDALVKEDASLTQKIVGPKGLQQRLVDERVKQTNLELEQKSVAPLLVNSVVESELILKRTKALEERIKELKKAGE